MNIQTIADALKNLNCKLVLYFNLQLEVEMTVAEFIEYMDDKDLPGDFNPRNNENSTYKTAPDYAEIVQKCIDSDNIIFAQVRYDLCGNEYFAAASYFNASLDLLMQDISDDIENGVFNKGV